MTTPIANTPISETTFTSPSANSSPDADARLAPEASQTVARRLLERFALIAFGLYHVPLFLNNYPSLGGGGFNDTGLAVRWGHVFTPVGVWVARHAFHMSGPMPSGYQGDNGDVGEEFGRLLASIVIAALAALWWTVADRRRPGARWVGEATRVLLRYSIALGITSYGVAKILPQQFPPLSPITLDQRVGDQSPMGLLWEFMEYSRPYAFFGGVMELVVALLLCFRRTATLGALVCLAVMTNVALLNYAYGVPVKLYSTMIVVSAAVLVLYDARRLLAVFVRNESAPAEPSSPLFEGRISPATRWLIKVALVGSVAVSSVVAMSQGIGRRATPSTLDGRWIVSSFTLNGQSLDSTGNPARWRRLVFDGGRVMIRLESDAAISCGRRPSSTDGTMALACANDRRANLRWTLTGDTLLVAGTFDGAQVSATGRRAPYPLLQSRFRLIFDR